MFSCSFWEKTWSDPAVLWVAATALLTALLVWVAWRQLGSLAQTSTSDFLFRLKSDFFTFEARKLVFLIEQELLRFEDAEIPYFSIPDFDKPELQPRLRELGIAEPTVSMYALDDIILGPLEDVAFYLSEKRITRTQVSEVFSYYICMCAESKAVQDYKAACRKLSGDPDIYAGLDNLQKLMCKKSVTQN